MQIYVHRNNQQIGPFIEAEVRAQLASGAISVQDHAWWQGQAGWVPLSQTPFAGPGVVGAPAAPDLPASGVSYPAGSVASTSNLAIWSLVCGCLGFFLSLLASIPAIVLGHMALQEIKRNPAIKGRGMAVAGTILGYIFTLLLPIISIVAISVLIALGNQVKGTFDTINAQLKAAQADTNSADQNPSASDQTNSLSATPDSSTTNSADQSTNSALASTNSPDTSTNNDSPSTNAPSSTTNAPATNQ
jgi:Domain of unknown function (DUF4190)/GYF domain 2